MKLKEEFERIGCEEDEKARRVVNVSAECATITADEIENGVTLERLAGVGVPVFRYATQVTIHGRLPEFDEAARPGGYKAVIRNGNGTVGVRYCAIDAEKKRLIMQACRCAARMGRLRTWGAHYDSQGLHLVTSFEKKEEAIAGLHAFPRDLIFGSVCAGVSPLGGYFAIAYIGAVAQQNLWPLLDQLYGFASEEALNKELQAFAAHDEAEMQKHRQRIVDMQAELGRKQAELAAATNLPKLGAVERRPGQFIRVSSGIVNSTKLVLVHVARRGACLCYATTEVDANAVPTKWSKAETRHFDRWNEEAKRGQVFRAP